MTFQKELQNSKQIVRDWVRTNFSDEKLASVTAFNADGKMSFRNPCGCLMGVTHSEFLHSGHGCDRKHYWRARICRKRAVSPRCFRRRGSGRPRKLTISWATRPRSTTASATTTCEDGGFPRCCAQRCGGGRG
jgi:hypothetical protein